MGTLIYCTHNEMYNASFTLLILSYSTFETCFVFNESSLLVSNSTLGTYSSIIFIKYSTLILNLGKLLFKKNKCYPTSNLVDFYIAQMIMENDSLVTFAHNEIENSVTFYYTNSIWNMSSDSNLQLLNNTASGTFLYTNASFSGRVRVTNNFDIYYGAISFISSVVWFNGNLED